MQFYFNGHNRLAAKLKEHGSEHRLLDNAFIELSDFAKAQQLSDDLDIARLHQKLDDYAKLCCPVIATLGVKYHKTLMQVEYSTDIIFKQQKELALLYGELSRAAIHTVKPDQGRSYKGLNFFHAADQKLIEVIARSEFAIHGLRNKDLRRQLPELNTAQISRRLKSLRLHGLIKRGGRTYKYYLSELGCRVIITGLKLKELFLIPQLAQPAPARIS